MTKTKSVVSYASMSSKGDEVAYKLQRTLHIKSMKVKDSLVSDEYWKDVCAKNFPFIDQELNSNKDSSINAAKLAQMHDDMELYKL